MRLLRRALTPLLLLMWGTAAIGQLNSYRFVMVPKQFQAFKEQNQYHTSTLVKYLLTEAGFTAYYEGEGPGSQGDVCDGLKIGLIDESGMLSTKVTLILEDCRGNEVFRTAQGVSREKELRAGYKDAIETAFRSIENLGYHYEPKSDDANPVVINFDGDVKNPEDSEAEEETKTAEKNTTDPVVVQEASPGEQRYVNRSPRTSDFQKANTPKDPVVPGEVATEAEDPWFAQPIPNGYQLVDRTPAIRLRLYSSSRPDVFIAENDEVHGVVYSHDERWYFEYYRDGKKVVRELDIRF